MILGQEALAHLKEAVNEATRREFDGVAQLRNRVRDDFKAVRLNYRTLRALAPVATDGGENRLSFKPLRIDIIRVADSEGKKHVERIIPLTSSAEDYESIFESTPVLKKLLDRLNVGYESLSYFLPKKRTDEESKSKSTSRDYANILRDIIEWAVLLELAWKERSILLLRDGLLRTKSMTGEVVKRMAASFQEAYDNNDTLLLGVAKKSKVLNYLALALSLEGTFHKDYPCFCEVPEDIEEKAYNWDVWQEGDYVFGQMHLVKLSSSRRGLILPVDVPHWLMDRKKEALEYLVDTARTTFPVIGYPYPLSKAHDYAVLGGLEVDIIGSLVENVILSMHNEKEQARLIELLRLEKGLTSGEW